MKFVVDGMLGGLARWLRILGQAVAYSSQSSDTALLALADSEARILLTGDRELYRRALARNIQSVLLTAQTEEERLAQIARQLRIPLVIDTEKTCCPDCGNGLRPAPKQAVAELVPAASLRLYREFWRCTNSGCGKVYWRGSHWKQIDEMLNKAKRLVELETGSRMLNISEGTLLVHCARNAIESRLAGKGFTPPSLVTPNLEEKRGVFVTLLDTMKGGALRGCIGNPFPEKPLLSLTPETAIEAATMDPRFNAITRDDLPRLIVEVSILSPLETLHVREPLELSQRVEVGKHGLLVEGRGMRSILLPQVAIDEGFDSEEFLAQCCLKAGLLPDAWVTGELGISVFETQVFSEEKPNGQVSERDLSRPRSV